MDGGFKYLWMAVAESDYEEHLLYVFLDNYVQGFVIRAHVKNYYSPVPNNSPPLAYSFSRVCFADISEIVKTDGSICETVSSLVQTVLINDLF